MKRLKTICLLMFLMISSNIIALAQTFSVSGKVFYQNETETQPLAFATIKVYSSVGDSLHLMKGCVSSSSGNWSVDELKSGNYQIEVSYVGMRKQHRVLQLNQNVRNLDFTLHEDTELLEVVIVNSKRQNRHMDKTVYTFSNEDVEKSMDARDLLANIPNLYLNTMNHQLSTLDGKSMLVLVNGVPSDDIDLRLLSPYIVKNVEYYDVPPIKYASSAQVVINVHLKPNDNGWNFSNDASMGKIFDRIVPAYSYIKNKHKFTISATSFINPKYETTNIEKGIYEYKLRGNNYKYEYEANKSDWGNQNKLQLKYLNATENDYTFCLNASVSYNDIRNKEERDICLAVNDVQDNAQGGIRNKVFTWNSSLNAYYNKVIDKNNALTLDAVGTYYGNKQRTISSENGQNAYYDNMVLKNNKYSIIGEALYESNHDVYQFCIGYKFSTAHIRNFMNNSISDGNWEDINTIQHYYYGQLKQSFGPFSYELALAGTSDIRKGLETCSNTTFTPRVMTGYRINDDQYVRLKYSSYTIVPDMMQTSQNRILIMNNMYKAGNPDLKIANIHTLDLTYSFNKKGFDVESDIFYRNNRYQHYDGYFDKGTYLEKKTLNYDKNIEMGIELSLNYDICKYLNLGAYFTPTCQSFRPNGYETSYTQWSFPITILARANYKDWSFSYYQKLGNYYLNGIYREGIEKVSSIAADYKYKRLWFTLSCYFPFIEDKYTSKIIDGSSLKHSTNNHVIQNSKAIQFSIYLSLHSGKQKRDNKKIENEDMDKGIFNLQ